MTIALVSNDFTHCVYRA